MNDDNKNNNNNNNNKGLDFIFVFVFRLVSVLLSENLKDDFEFVFVCVVQKN